MAEGPNSILLLGLEARWWYICGVHTLEETHISQTNAETFEQELDGQAFPSCQSFRAMFNIDQITH